MENANKFEVGSRVKLNYTYDVKWADGDIGQNFPADELDPASKKV